MKIIKIFLASSKELKADRKEFELYIGRKNKKLVKNGAGLFLDLEIWEDFLDAMSKTSLQNEYEKVIRECDLFIMLFFTKVGKYTNREFEAAFGRFKETDKPYIYTYFKDAEVFIGSLNRQDMMSLFDFQEKLKSHGHFCTHYKNIEDLKFHFNNQLETLIVEDPDKLIVEIPGLERKRAEVAYRLRSMRGQFRNICFFHEVYGLYQGVGEREEEISTWRLGRLIEEGWGEEAALTCRYSKLDRLVLSESERKDENKIVEAELDLEHIMETLGI